MKQTLIGILIIFFFNISSFCQTKIEKEKKVLLLKYHENIQCKQIDNLKQKDSITWNNNCEDLLAIVDDFSAFFYNTGKFFAQTNLTRDENVKIIFWDYGNIKEIVFKSFPFNYSKIKISSQMNDSTIIVSYDNKDVVLRSKTEMQDSIVEITKNEKSFSCLKTNFSIENIGLINLDNIIDLNKVEFKQTGALIEELSDNEIKSRYDGGLDSLTSFIIKNIADTIEYKGQIVLGVNIDYTGKIKKIFVLRGDNPSFINEVTRVISLTKWRPSVYPKDFIFALPIRMK